MKYYFNLLFLFLSFSISAHPSFVIDEERNRKIPVKVSAPENAELCNPIDPCPVVFINAGYGIPHSGYLFIEDFFNTSGYLTIAIGHELEGDPPLAVSGKLLETRSENWNRGAQTIEFIRRYFKPRKPAFDFDNVLLIGHSNGGDISAWLANRQPAYIKSIITLDHRRVPLPKTVKIRVLSVRASDYPADEDVLPTLHEQIIFNSCVGKIKDARHNEMWDEGPSYLKDEIVKRIDSYLHHKTCIR